MPSSMLVVVVEVLSRESSTDGRVVSQASPAASFCEDRHTGWLLSGIYMVREPGTECIIPRGPRNAVESASSSSGNAGCAAAILSTPKGPTCAMCIVSFGSINFMDTVHSQSCRSEHPRYYT